MSLPSLLDEILTEFDERISSELNLDPLGLQVIWSAYGQAIFRSRISSISNDVRNYTLNLFNHRVVKSLAEDDSVVLGRGLQQQRAYAGNKNSLPFKQACLVHLENLFAYAMVETENGTHEEVKTGGVLGISKARRRWHEANADPVLVFSHEPVAHVLVRQNSLGVSGRYKTPLVQMKFFDSAYDYAQPDSRALWQTAEEHLFAPAKPLAGLHVLVHQYMADLLSDTRREPQRLFSDIPKGLRQGIVHAFREPRAVGAYAREFWLSVTQLDQGASGALYDVLNSEHLAQPKEPWPASAVFGKAGRAPSLAATEQEKLQHVARLEPFLGELDLLLTAMLSAQAHSLDSVAVKWKDLGRNETTLGGLAQGILNDPAMRKQIAGTASARLADLTELACAPTLQLQMKGLLKYHGKIMESRGQSPWLRLLNDESLKIDVRARELPHPENRPVGDWVHQYYIPQFRLLLSGLRGMEA